MIEIETLNGEVENLRSQVRYQKLKMMSELEEMKLRGVEEDEEILEHSIESRLDKERNIAVIEAARAEQSLLREATRQLKVDKIRLSKKLDVFNDRKQEPDVSLSSLVKLDEHSNRIAIAQDLDVKLGMELQEVICIATEHQEKLTDSVKIIEKAFKKKIELLEYFTAIFDNTNHEESTIQFKKEDEIVKEVIDIKADRKAITTIGDRIKRVEKDIEDKSKALEEVLRDLDGLVASDREKLMENRKESAEKLKEVIISEKRKIVILRREKFAKFEEEKDHLERKELGLNISLANLNMVIEYHNSRIDKDTIGTSQDNSELSYQENQDIE